MNSFTPSIVQGLGYTASRAQLMSVPPFAVAFVGRCTLPRLQPLLNFEIIFMSSINDWGLFFRSLWMPRLRVNVFLHLMRYRFFNVSR